MRRLILLLVTAALIAPVVPAAAATFTPGAQQSGDPYFPQRGNGGYDAFSYSVTVEVNVGSTGTPRTIKAVSIMTATAKQNLSRFSMDLDGLTVKKVLVGGKSAKFSRTGAKLIITPAAGILKGKTFLTQVEYSGAPKKVPGPDGRYFEGWLETDDGVSAVGDPNSALLWMPVNDDVADKAIFSVTARVPAGYVAFSNGKLVRPGKMVKGMMEYVWKAAEPMAPHYVLLSVGKFETIDTYVLPRTFVLHGIDPSIDPDLQTLIKKQIAASKEILEFYQSKFGPYPFESYGSVFDRLDSSFSVDTQTRAFYPDGAINEAALEEFYVHQISHAWFGQSVSPARTRDIFLTESFAQYATWMWLDKKNPGTLETLFNNIYQNGVETLWDINIADPGPTKLFDLAVYYRGPMVLHMVRKTMGDDAFFSMLKAWTTAKKYKIATVEEFVDFAQSKSSKDLSLLFRDWLYTPSKPTRTSY